MFVKAKAKERKRDRVNRKRVWDKLQLLHPMLSTPGQLTSLNVNIDFCPSVIEQITSF